LTIATAAWLATSCSRTMSFSLKAVLEKRTKLRTPTSFSFQTSGTHRTEVSLFGSCGPATQRASLWMSGM
jgi:hypothetical protein